MKTRIIPTILTDGLTVVKGEKFNNWRTVGSAEATARLYANRNVDELLFLDVTARIRNTIIDINLLAHFSEVLDIPFSVGGGISTLKDAQFCFRNGAEKVVLGTEAVNNPNLITQISDTFGNQAVVVSIDLDSDTKGFFSESGKKLNSRNAIEFALQCQELGAGEILLQSVAKDGLLNGFDTNSIKSISDEVSIPLIASSGAGRPEDFLKAIEAGASAVAAGAIFQFTEHTPTTIRNYLKANGISVREIG